MEGLCWKQGDGNRSTRKEEGKARGKMVTVRGLYQREGTVGGRKCTTVLRGSVYRHTSTPHKSRTKMKRRMKMRMKRRMKRESPLLSL